MAAVAAVVAVAKTSEGSIPNSPLDYLTLLIEMKPEMDRLAATVDTTAATATAATAAVIAAVAAMVAMEATPTCSLGGDSTLILGHRFRIFNALSKSTGRRRLRLDSEPADGRGRSMKRKKANQSPTQTDASWVVACALGHHLPMVLLSNYAKKPKKLNH